MIVTAESYMTRRPDDEFTEAEIENVLDIAEHVVEEATCGKTKQYDSFPADVKEKVVKAICAQTDFILKNFGADLNDIIPESASIGSFSYSTGGGSEKALSPGTLNHVAKRLPLTQKSV